VKQAIVNGDQILVHTTNLRQHHDRRDNKPDNGWYVQPQTAFRSNQGASTLAIMGTLHRENQRTKFCAFDPPLISNLGKDDILAAPAASSSSSSSS
jgi:hypothetical protein